jgi:hypothetical protein
MPIAKLKITAAKSAQQRARKVKVEASAEQSVAVAANITPAPVKAAISTPASTAAPVPTGPRHDSKLGIVVGLLQQPEGASLARLVEVTGWLPHTTRAALTGLRKRGFVVSSSKAAGEKDTTYQIRSGVA